MQGRLILLVEEPSMKVLVDGLLPRLFPGWQKGTHFLCVPHEGKSDLDKSVPRKLKEWKFPGDRFVIVRDNDNADCVVLKARTLLFAVHQVARKLWCGWCARSWRVGTWGICRPWRRNWFSQIWIHPVCASALPSLTVGKNRQLKLTV